MVKLKTYGVENRRRFSTPYVISLNALAQTEIDRIVRYLAV